VWHIDIGLAIPKNEWLAGAFGFGEKCGWIGSRCFWRGGGDFQHLCMAMPLAGSVLCGLY
jgi:hypothetical protein